MPKGIWPMPRRADMDETVRLFEAVHVGRAVVVHEGYQMGALLRALRGKQSIDEAALLAGLPVPTLRRVEDASAKIDQLERAAAAQGYRIKYVIERA